MVAEGGEGVGESSAGGDFGELVVVADEDHLRAVPAGGGDDVVEVDGAAHPGLADHDDRVTCHRRLVDEALEAGNSERGDVCAGFEFAGGTR